MLEGWGGGEEQHIVFMRQKVRRVSAEGGGHVSAEKKKGTKRGQIGVVIQFKLVDDPACPERILRSCRQQTRLEVSARFTSFYFHRNSEVRHPRCVLNYRKG